MYVVVHSHTCVIECLRSLGTQPGFMRMHISIYVYGCTFTHMRDQMPSFFRDSTWVYAYVHMYICIYIYTHKFNCTFTHLCGTPAERYMHIHTNTICNYLIHHGLCGVRQVGGSPAKSLVLGRHELLCMCVCVCVCMYALVLGRHELLYMYVCMCVCMCLYVCMCMCVAQRRIHTYRHPCIHACTYLLLYPLLQVIQVVQSA